ncbi:hypothetical protein L914_21468 [Phytophthora nicotianae]|uniref:Uncharacterized protein n=1 Tax=Phytophthora nicotianae TaxID=4792 RepID=W2M5K6_PHYNI|nr:hypothetical protein L914_21468 [Phytophthora nicotianae]
MLAASASSLMALQTYKGVGFGGEVEPNLSAISDAEGIQAGLTAASLAYAYASNLKRPAGGILV